MMRTKFFQPTSYLQISKNNKKKNAVDAKHKCDELLQKYEQARTTNMIDCVSGDASDTDDDVQFQEYSQPLFTENQDEFPNAITSTGGNDGK